MTEAEQRLAKLEREIKEIISDSRRAFARDEGGCEYTLMAKLEKLLPAPKWRVHIWVADTPANAGGRTFEVPDITEEAARAVLKALEGFPHLEVHAAMMP